MRRRIRTALVQNPQSSLTTPSLNRIQIPPSSQSQPRMSFPFFNGGGGYFQRPYYGTPIIQTPPMVYANTGEADRVQTFHLSAHFILLVGPHMAVVTPPVMYQQTMPMMSPQLTQMGQPVVMGPPQYYPRRNECEEDCCCWYVKHSVGRSPEI